MFVFLLFLLGRPLGLLHASLTRVSCSLICAAFGLGFCLCTDAIAATDDSYTNLIAPYQRVQLVSGLVHLYFLLMIHATRLPPAMCSPAWLAVAASLMSCEFYSDQPVLHSMWFFDVCAPPLLLIQYRSTRFHHIHARSW